MGRGDRKAARIRSSEETYRLTLVSQGPNIHSSPRSARTRIGINIDWSTAGIKTVADELRPSIAILSSLEPSFHYSMTSSAYLSGTLYSCDGCTLIGDRR